MIKQYIMLLLIFNHIHGSFLGSEKSNNKCIKHILFLIFKKPLKYEL